MRANVNLHSHQSESDRCRLLVNISPSHDELGGAVLVSGGAVQAPEGAFVVPPSCLGAAWGAGLVSGGAVQAPGGTFVGAPLCLGASWGAVLVSGAAVQMLESIFV